MKQGWNSPRHGYVITTNRRTNRNRAGGFYDDIVRARDEMANRSGIDQQLIY
jgi:hypothetical protein